MPDEFIDLSNKWSMRKIASRRKTLQIQELHFIYLEGGLKRLFRKNILHYGNLLILIQIIRQRIKIRFYK